MADNKIFNKGEQKRWKPFLCMIGIHAFVELGSGNAETFHDVYNPVKFKNYICKRNGCCKMKTLHYQVPGQI